MNTWNGRVLNVFGRVNFILDKVQKDIQGDKRNRQMKI